MSKYILCSFSACGHCHAGHLSHSASLHKRMFMEIIFENLVYHQPYCLLFPLYLSEGLPGHTFHDYMHKMELGLLDLVTSILIL